MWIDHVRFDNTYPPHQMYTHTIPLFHVVTAIVTTVVTFYACNLISSRASNYVG